MSSGLTKLLRKVFHVPHKDVWASRNDEDAPTAARVKFSVESRTQFGAASPTHERKILIALFICSVKDRRSESRVSCATACRQGPQPGKGAWYRVYSGATCLLPT